MKSINDLNLGFNDAENYKRRENKTLFNEIFIQNKYLAEILRPSTYFIIGEKGTGKTAYSVFLANTIYSDKISKTEFKSQIKYIRETEYEKFITLKSQKHLQLSDYTAIWKIIIMLLFAKSITREEIDEMHFSKGNKIKALLSAVDEYYKSAFSPEIINALEFIENDSRAAELLFKYASISAQQKTQTKREEHKFQLNLMYIQRQFEAALSDLKLKRNHIIFIDGIDIRPGRIPFQDYLECVKGLAHAIWSLNSDFFADIKDSKGRFKAVCLIRPDIFNSLNLQNAANKVFDNAVLLDWKTTYPEHRESELFKLSDKLLSSQQDSSNSPIGEVWDKYLPFSRSEDCIFIDILRITYSRPRDIVTLLQFMRRQMVSCDKGDMTTFDKETFLSSEFQNAYSEYLMSSIKDQLAFYYSEEDYMIFIHFFSFLNGKMNFDYNEYKQAYSEYEDYIMKRDSTSIPEFVDSCDKFLQFLYETNVICYFEYTANPVPFMRWCYRERSMSNINPKVRTNTEYRIHYGLAKALNVGNVKTKTRK